MFNIDAPSEIPPSRAKYPWDKLELVGQSFLIEESFSSGCLFARQLVYAKNKSKKSELTGVKYKAVKDVGGMRIFRVA